MGVYGCYLWGVLVNSFDINLSTSLSTLYRNCYDYLGGYIWLALCGFRYRRYAEVTLSRVRSENTIEMRLGAITSIRLKLQRAWPLGGGVIAFEGEIRK